MFDLLFTGLGCWSMTYYFNNHPHINTNKKWILKHLSVKFIRDFVGYFFSCKLCQLFWFSLLLSLISGYTITQMIGVWGVAFLIYYLLKDVDDD